MCGAESLVRATLAMRELASCAELVQDPGHTHLSEHFHKCL